MKYIDADPLKKVIEKRFWDYGTPLHDDEVTTKVDEILSFIDSFQQEQPDLPGIEESGIPGKDYIPVEWVDACEKFGKWKIVKQEQSEVDLEKEIEKELRLHYNDDQDIYWWNYLKNSFRHFYELGLNARKE